MKSRIASVLTVVALLAGTGGAIAVGNTGSSGSAQGGAASGQYCNGKDSNPGKCKGHHKHHHGEGNKGKHGEKGQHGNKGEHGNKGQHGNQGNKGKHSSVKGVSTTRGTGATSLTG